LPLARRLHVEALEDRRLLAAITVTSLADNAFPGGGVTLREAIQAANTDTSVDGSALGNGADTILFDATLFATPQTITLDGLDLEITEALTIDATSLAENVTIDADERSRVFNITATTGDFTLAGLTLTSGLTAGYNIFPATTFNGGAIRSLTTGSLTIDQSTVSENRTEGDSSGGGIFSVGDVILTSSIVSRNSTSGEGGGIFSSLGTVTLTSSTINGNSTTGLFVAGGGIRSTGTVTLTNSIVSGNYTTENFTYGGGIFSSADVTLTNSTVSGNSTTGKGADGGGIRSFGDVTLTRSTVSGNSTAGASARGGGIFSSGTVTVANSTVSGNSTAGFFAYGGGIFSFGALTLTSSTVTDNRANYSNATGGGIWNNNDTITIANSIVAGNTAGGGSPDIDPRTGIFTVNFSLLGSAVTPDTGGSGNLSSDNPLLGLLANNGGPTETHALLVGSLAIDAGDPEIVSPPSFDQRGSGFDRVRDGDGDTTAVIDIGAFERQSPPALSADFDNDNDIDGADFLAWQRGFNKPSNVIKADGDADNDGDVDGTDLGLWGAQFGGPASLLAGASSPSASVDKLLSLESPAVIEAIFSEPVAPTTFPRNLIDAALATEWLGVVFEEKETARTPEKIVVEAAFAVNSEANWLAPAGKTITKFGATHANSEEAALEEAHSDQLWLAELLLERAFG